MWAGHSRVDRGRQASDSHPRTAAHCTNSAGRPAASSATWSAVTTPVMTGRSGPASAEGSDAASVPVASAPVASVPASARPDAADDAGAPGGGGGRRGRRGDVRAAILVLLAERPMHGYEIIQEVAERSQDLWKPSPGSVYPTLQLLVDESLIVSTESEASKMLFALTYAGKEAAEKVATPPWEEITDGADPAQMNLRAA